jgi:YDG domain/MBG domain (YGX type)/Bacterial Ig-like domain (group 3)/Galactose oxidase, central domain/Kelch motif
MKRRTFAAPLGIALSLAFFGLLAQGAVPDVPTGQWLPGPALAQPRAGAVSVALDDGRVLVIGGRTSQGPVDTVEVLNADGSMAVAAPMLARRTGHAAAKLPDGRVLVLGGTTLVTSGIGNGPVTSEAVTNSAEIFDAFANVWSPAASLSVARSGHTATATADGRVLVAGGTGQDGAALDSFEVFDAETGQFATPGLMSAPRANHAAAVAGTTKVLVAGGRNANGVLGTADVINVESGTVSSVVLNSPRADASATTLLDGKVLVAGGSNGVTDLASAEVIDPVTGVSMPTGSMSQARSSHQALLLNHNNTVLVTGGTSNGAVVASAEQFVPWTDQFTATGSPAIARASAVSSNLSKDGVAWLATGRAADNTLVAASEFFGFATLKTDKDDYPPGSTVVISGSGWQPGERVTMVLHEVGTGHADRTYYADADTAGRITNNQFATDLSHIGVRFYLSARGAASHAQVTFTDALSTMTALTSSVNPSSSGQSVTFTATVTYVQAGSGHQIGDPVTEGTVLFGENGNQNCGGGGAGAFSQLQAPLIPNANGQVTFTTSSLSPGDHTIRACYSGTLGNGTGNSNDVLTQKVNACSAPSVTTPPAAQSIVYGANAMFTAAASGSPAPSAQWQVSTNGGGSWADLPGQTGTTLTLTKPTVAMSGNQYRVVFTNTCTPSTATSSAGLLTVSPKNLTITGAAAQSKMYDGTTAATVSFSGASLVGVESGDVVSINSAGHSANFNNKTVGNAKPVAVTDVTLSGADASNYTVSQPSGLTANITAKNLTISGALAQSKTYDGTTAAAVDFNAASLNGVVGGDAVTINFAGYSATFASKNIGSWAVTVTGVTLAGADAINYTVSQPSGLTAQILAKNLTISGAVAQDKTYDGTTAATVDFSAATLNGVVGSEIVTINVAGYSASFADKNAGTWAVTVTGVMLVGPDAGNYTVAQPAGLTAQILAKNLTISGAVAQDKTYDATTAATVDLSAATLNGVVGSEVVTIDASGYSASFADKNIGTSAVTVTGVMLAGADAGNYTVSQPSGLTAEILAKNLTISGAVAQGKTYDGTTAATVDFSAARLNGVVGGEDVTINSGGYSASFADENVGTWAVTVTGVTLAGAHAGNYTVSQPAGVSTEILAKNLTITGAVAQNKTYDGTTAATVDFSAAALSGIVGTEDVTINAAGYSADFADKTVGGNKPVTIIGVALSGAAAGNYTVSQPSGLKANITHRSLTVSASGIDKVYDGTTAATVTLSDDRVSGDVFTASYTTATFGDKHVGTGKAVSVSGVSIAGTDAGNYTLADMSASTSANISARNLTVTASASNKVYDGTTAASVTLADDRVSDDALVIAFASATFSDKNAASDKTVTVNGISVAGADAGNYLANTSITATADITPAPLTIVAVDKAITFGAPGPTFTVTWAGFVAGETSSVLSGTMTYTFEGVAPTSYGPSTTVPTAVGTYKNTPGGVASTNYSIAFTPGSYTISAWTLTGFYQPVTMGGIYNTVKGGSTVPLKFHVYQGAQGVNERTDIAAIDGFAVIENSCGAGPEDPLDFITTGGTSLRYDTTARQFIQNWQTPKGPGRCYGVTMTTADGSTLVAFFKTK